MSSPSWTAVFAARAAGIGGVGGSLHGDVHREPVSSSGPSLPQQLQYRHRERQHQQHQHSGRAGLTGLSRIQYRRQDSSEDSYASTGGGVGVARNFLLRSVPFTDGTSPNSLSPSLLKTSCAASATNKTSTSTTASAPFLTLTLLKLDDLLDEYSRLLAHPSYKNAAMACALLETSIATATTASSPNHNHNNNFFAASSPSSPARGGNFLIRSPRSISPPESPSNRSTGSSTNSVSSTLRNWLTLSPQQQQHHHHHPPPSPTSKSAMALEGEWESFQRPFLLLAAAEVLYVDTQHLLHNDSSGTSPSSSTTATTRTLQGLYKHVTTELLAMEQTLCAPFLNMLSTTTKNTSGGAAASSRPVAPSKDAATTTTTTTTSSNKYTTAATHVSKTLQTLVALCTCRCHLMDVQSNLFFHNPPTSGISTTTTTTTMGLELDDAKAALSVVRSLTEQSLDSISIGGSPTTPTTTGAAAAAAAATSCSGDDLNHDGTTLCMLRESLLQELDTWKYCLDAALGLEACQFFDTIVSLSQFKESLPCPADTRLYQWFQQTEEYMTSLLPIYFDRVQSFAGPLYGFEPQHHYHHHHNSKNLRSPNISSSKSSSTTASSSNQGDDWNAAVVELLRKQDKLGGPPTAIGLVLDAVSTNNLQVERGFQLSSGTKNSSNHAPRTNGVVAPGMGMTKDVGDEKVADEGHDATLSSSHWPAVYLRSTMHLNSTPHMVNTSLSSSRASLASNSVRGSSSVRGSGFLKAGGWSSSSHDIHQVGGGSAGHLKNIDESSLSVVSSHNYNVLEYDPDAGQASSWPHNEWSLVAASLENTQHEIINSNVNISSSIRMEPPVQSPRSRTTLLADGAAVVTGPALAFATATTADGLPIPTVSPRMTQEPVAVTYRDDDDDHDKPHHQQLFHHHRDLSSTSSLLSMEGAAGLFRTSTSSASTDALPLLPVVSFSGNSASDDKSGKRQTTTFHVVSLSRYISLFAIVKGDNTGEGRFLRRRSRLADEDIRAFLDHWAINLRVSNRFTRTRLMTLPAAEAIETFYLEFPSSMQTNATTAIAPDTEARMEQWIWTAERVGTYFKQIKDAFGLRPTSPIREGAARSRSFGRIIRQRGSTNTGNTSSPSNRKSFASFPSFASWTSAEVKEAATQLNRDIEKSVDALFLGPELAQVMEMGD